MRRTRLLAALILGVLVLTACGRDDYGHDGDHMNRPGHMNGDRPEPTPAK